MKEQIYKICTQLNDGQIAVAEAQEQLLLLFSVSNRREQLLAYEKWRNGHILNSTDQWHEANVDLFLSQ